VSGRTVVLNGTLSIIEGQNQSQFNCKVCNNHANNSECQIIRVESH
jgi:hypothetical protein